MQGVGEGIQIEGSWGYVVFLNALYDFDFEFDTQCFVLRLIRPCLDLTFKPSPAALRRSGKKPNGFKQIEYWGASQTQGSLLGSQR